MDELETLARISCSNEARSAGHELEEERKSSQKCVLQCCPSLQSRGSRFFHLPAVEETEATWGAALASSSSAATQLTNQNRWFNPSDFNAETRGCIDTPGIQPQQWQ
jgi:hypothetical protein